MKKHILGIGMTEEIISEVRKDIQPKGLEAVNVSSFEEAFNFIATHSIRLVIIKKTTAGIENYQEFCVLLRSRPKIANVPIIFIADKEKESISKVEMLRSGLANEYITLPASIDEIIARVNIFIELRRLQEDLEIKNRLLKRTSITDELTGLYNRRYILERLSEEMCRVKRYNYWASCALIDIDYFKKINDKYGHQAGDLILKEVVKLLKNNIRATDIIGRYGGDEFLLILPFTDSQRALIPVERLKGIIKDYKFLVSEKELRLTLSIGLVSFQSSDDADTDKIIQIADEQLYLAKTAGRNTVKAKA